MKDIFRSFIMAFSMFSVIPMPQIQWKKENMKYMLAWMPLVGVCAGALQAGWLYVCGALSFGPLLFAAGLVLLPLILTGGIHMDGFMDTVDALSSHASVEKKREILKDPNTGAFAVIYCVCYIVLSIALCAEVPRTPASVLMLGLHQVSARALGAFASVCFPSSSNTGLQHTFRDAAAKRVAVLLIIWEAACALGMFFLSFTCAAACVIVFFLSALYLYRMSSKEFGGMSGDLAGYIITLSELLMLICYVTAEKMAV